MSGKKTSNFKWNVNIVQFIKMTVSEADPLEHEMIVTLHCVVVGETN